MAAGRGPRRSRCWPVDAMAIDYGVLKGIHMSCAVVTYALFVVRGLWRFDDSPRADVRWVRVAPHLIDTVLLASALGMAWTLVRFPAMHPFLLTKLLSVCAYIALGMVALRFGRTRRVRLVAWFGAQAVFLYIVGVAISKSPSLTLLGRIQ